MEARSVSSSEYYWNYHGQRIDHLNAVHASLRESCCKSFVWLAGDSSLDNKHWLFNGEKSNPSVMRREEIAAPAVNGYEHILSPPRMARDVCYWLNVGLHTARQESTLGQRLEGEGHGLLPQDEFIRDHITEDDVLIVDLGGNDVALRPTTWTALNMAALIYLSATCVIRSLSFAVAPCNGWYCGFPLGLGYFVNMFKNKTTAYIEKVIEKRKPKKVVVCMLYYLDQNPSGSWADKILGLLGYDKDPAKLKAVIKRVYELGTSAIRIPGVEVVAFPLFTALDGTDATDYIARVEPSVQGGRKMAEALLPAVLGRGMPSPE
mmetsp:Transcript_150399/g.481353  ORF Transcript_150399/g.481353 Transcript_150399/m.481353 type:complete len:320 (-) Transcript_150399:120-1079(-)